MDDSTFESLADRTLARLQTQIEDALDNVDVDLRGGILTLELEDGRQYVINKHMPNHQIWLSSPISGAAHFDHDPATGGWQFEFRICGIFFLRHNNHQLFPPSFF